MIPITAVYILWTAWFASWIVAAFWSTRAAKRPRLGAEVLYRLVIFIGALLLFGAGSYSYRRPPRLWAADVPLGRALVVLAAAGFLFCWWARLHLGTLWSGSVTKKADHRVVDTGPYRLVRHPIYTGIIAAAFATALLKGTPSALTGVAVMTLGFWIKARLEESFLRRELGCDVYDAYRRRVPMLVPFGPKAA